MQEPDRDLIPKSLAIRRGMTFRLNARGFVCEAKDESPLLIDRLYGKGQITQDHHFHCSQMITMRKVLGRDLGYVVGTLRVKSDETPLSVGEGFVIEDTDYLKVLRKMRNPRWKSIVMAICHEEAHERDCQQYPKEQMHPALDQLAGAIKNLWDNKKAIRDANNACQ